MIKKGEMGLTPKKTTGSEWAGHREYLTDPLTTQADKPVFRPMWCQIPARVLAAMLLLLWKLGGLMMGKELNVENQIQLRDDGVKKLQVQEVGRTVWDLEQEGATRRLCTAREGRRCKPGGARARGSG